MDVREMSMLAMCLGNVFLGFFAIGCQWYFDDRRCRKETKKDNDKKKRDMKTIEEKISVMQSYADGKKIVCRNKALDKHWFETASPLWDWNNYDYDVVKEPSYRPYKDAEECFKDVIKHGGWVRTMSGQYAFIHGIGGSGVMFGEEVPFPYERMCLSWVWADDGSVCGKLIDK